VGWTVVKRNAMRIYECSCGNYTGSGKEMAKHVKHPYPKTTLEVLQEFNAALVELRQAALNSMPNVIRKAFSKWDSEHTP
jgi:hypothetical protein